MPRVCITVTGKNSQPYRFSLERKIVRLGRAADNDIIIDCPSVSSHHCEMRRVSGGYILQDLDSTNGIKIDGARMEVIDLENDMEVTVGDADLDFELTSEELAELGDEDHSSHNKPKLPPVAPGDDEDGEAPAGEKDDDGTSGDRDEEPPKKARKKKKAPARKEEPVAAAQPSGGLNFLISLVFIALAIAVFYFGMSTKHNHTDNWPGRSLWHDLRGQAQPEEAPADPEPAPEGDGGGA